MLTQTFSAVQDCSAFPYVAIDAEWYKPLPGRTASYLTKQFTFYDNRLKPQLTLVLWDETRRLPRSKPDVGHPVIVIPCMVQETVLKDAALLAPKVNLIMYYSPKDVEATIGAKLWRDLLLSKNSPISKKRNLTGNFKDGETEYELMDLIGVFNKSLDAALKSVGIDNPYKDRVTQLNYSKDRMDLFIDGNPEAFLEYAVGDTVYLGDLLTMRVDQANQIIKDALGSEVPAFNVLDFPRSAGSLVAKTFEKWLIARYPGLMRAALLLTDSNDNRTWARLKSIKADLDQPEVDLERANKLLRASQYRHGLSMAAIPTYPLLCQNTGLFGSIVQGGRCVNEDIKNNPYEQRLENVVDIDLSSCYGSALRDFDYPVGIPTIYENAIDDEPVKLGEFLKANERYLVDGLYQIVVSGMLPFKQDLVHSKYGVSTKSILKTIFGESYDQETDTAWGRDIEPAHIGGDFVLTRKQIENGVITADNLKVIRKVSTLKELKDWMELDVVCAVYYPANLEVSHEEFTAIVANPKTRGIKTRNGDSRTRKWTRVHLEAFIGNFISYRKAVKKQSEVKGDVPDLLQESVKLFVNTTYGCLASPYFPMGNTVLANNITAKARTGVWMMSKALLTRQSITDGGIFSYKEVLYLRDNARLPGFNTLADRAGLVSSRYTKVAPLTDRDVWQWMKDRTVEDTVGIDRLCTDHINAFWGRYGLGLPFSIEVKYDHTARTAVYLNAADYLLVNTVNDRVPHVVKVRGTNEDNHPKKMFLWHLYDPSSYPLPDPEFYSRELIGVSDFQKTPYDELMPGDEIEVRTTHKPYPSGYFDTYQEYKQYQDRKRKMVTAYNKKDEPGYFGVSKSIDEGRFKLTQVP